MLNFTDIASTKFEGKILTIQDGRLVEFDLGAWLVDNAKAMVEGSPAGLKVRILASASGMLINNRVYPGTEWKKAAKSFEGKPVLKHHDSDKDAIGRIKKGEFKQLVFGDEFANDFQKPATQGKGQPTGLVYVDAVITDPDAVQKILDERLMHTSQGSRASGARCSICDSNWAEGHYCDHMPGRVYEDEESGKKKLCYWTIDGLQGKEVSLVNEPALGMSKIISTDSMTDAQDERFIAMLDEASHGAATILGSNADRLYLTDAKGRIQDVRVIKEEKYEVLDLSGNIEKQGTDNDSADNSADGEPVLHKEKSTMSDPIVNTKPLEDEIKGLKDQVTELTESSKKLREEKKDLEQKLADKQGILDTLENEYNTLLEKVQKELIDSYVKEAGVTEDILAATKTHLATLDVDTLSFMVSEAKRLKASAPSVVTNGIKPEAEGTEGGSANDAGTATPKPKKRKSPLRKSL